MPLNSRQRNGFVARTAAILTGSAVASNILDIHQTVDGWVQVAIAFTKGSLTSVDIQPQVLGPDGNWEDVTDPGKLNLTADGNKSFAVNCKGVKQFRCTALGNGTATSSSLSLWFGWQQAGGAIG